MEYLQDTFAAQEADGSYFNSQSQCKEANSVMQDVSISQFGASPFTSGFVPSQANHPSVVPDRCDHDDGNPTSTSWPVEERLQTPLSLQSNIDPMDPLILPMNQVWTGLPFTQGTLPTSPSVGFIEEMTDLPRIEITPPLVPPTNLTPDAPTNFAGNARTRRTRKTEGEWARYKGTIQELYIHQGMTLAETMEEMSNKYGFNAS